MFAPCRMRWHQTSSIREPLEARSADVQITHAPRPALLEEIANDAVETEGERWYIATPPSD
jgi:hypothetical protein